ncbi:type VI secretion system tube protein TssD [Escherichia coli]|uniref:Hcp family type VI secretion system effector n=1 Tax=Escherichia coli TaxID=562 RepID=UPI00184DC0AA|nr:type VI secretion system tube protein Hcp [Escherichia coli]EFT2895881.1 type VI secretion system tube protein Hcp [Escherichia coli]
MPTPCYISITGQTQGNITAGAFTADSVGNIYVQGHEDEMLVQEFLHNVTVPTDPQSGQPAGQRAHKPFIFTVALNKAVPLMYNALASGEMLPTTELHWWRTSVEGKQEHYFTIRMHDERTHHYHYDSQHRLVFYTRIQHGEPQVESRYLYDPLGRRTGKRVWRRERDLTGWMSLSRKPEETWYGWDGDRLTTVQTQQTRIQTVYQPGSFTPLLRIETENGEQAKARHRSLAEVLQEDTGVTLPAELAVMLGRLERELRAGAVSAESEAWLAQCGLTVEQMESQMEAEYIPERRLHLYHCDHRGLPQALISPEGETAWCGEYDEWGNQLNEENPHHLYQPYRLPGQQYDEESGLYYNRHRYYDPLQGRYITQDPIGLKGGINLYTYPLAPIRYTDPLGLERVISVYGPPAPDRAGAETPLVLTDMTGGVTIYYDPETGDSMTFDSSNRIDRRSQRGAGDPYTGEVVGCETNESGISAAYGTTKIYTTDTRARWLHGGGSSLRDPYAPRQGWKPTMGCTRAQNEDVDELCKKVTSWMYSHPGERIRYERFKTR